MAYKITNNAEKVGENFKFNSVSTDELNSADNWFFKYVTLNTAGTEWKRNQEIETDKSKYPQPANNVLGTVFFDSNPETVYISSTISEVVIDTTPPEFIDENIQYTIFKEEDDYGSTTKVDKRTCKFTIHSDSYIDICQLEIACGSDIFYRCLRKADSRVISQNISDISYDKNQDTYVLSFKLNGAYSTELLTEKQLTITIWDIAGNTASYTTDKSHKWQVLTDSDTERLKVEFTKVNPENLVLSKNVEGEVLVKVTNPNFALWDIVPTVALSDGSIGRLDESTLTYDKTTGVLLFYVNGITRNGSVQVEAWLDIENSEVREFIKNVTRGYGIFGPFLFMEDGRKYKFDGYTPKYLNDELYKRFVKHVETFLNTSQRGLDSGNYISTLEKIARIGNFSDPFKIELALLDKYREQFNIEVNPRLEEYIHCLNHQSRKKEE